MRCPGWTDSAVRSVETLVNSAAEIRFTPKIHLVSNNHYFGYLSVQNFSGLLLTVNAELCKTSQAVHATDFQKAIARLNSTKVPRWQKNDGSTGIFQTGQDKVPLVTRVHATEFNPDDELHVETQAKVTAWNDRNEEILRDFEKCNLQFEKASSVVTEPQAQTEQFCLTAGTSRKQKLKLPKTSSLRLPGSDLVSNISGSVMKLHSISEIASPRVKDAFLKAPSVFTLQSTRSTQSKMAARALRSLEVVKARSIVSTKSKRSATLLPSGCEADTNFE